MDFVFTGDRNMVAAHVALAVEQRGREFPDIADFDFLEEFYRAALGHWATSAGPGRNRLHGKKSQ